MTDDTPYKLTPEQMKRWKELGWGETDEEFDARLSQEQDFLRRFEGATDIPDVKPPPGSPYFHTTIKFSSADILNWIKSWFKK